MTPKEFLFFCNLIENTARAAYEFGHKDGEARKPLNKEQFRITEGNKLSLKKELNKVTKTR